MSDISIPAQRVQGKTNPVMEYIKAEHGIGVDEPIYGSDGAAGLDLRAANEEDVMIAPGETKMIPTGIHISLPAGFFGMIAPRSGLAFKEGLIPINSPGIIDEDYRGEIKIALHNSSDQARWVQRNTRIAQMIVLPYVQVYLKHVLSLSETKRGEGGFGSTGKV